MAITVTTVTFQQIANAVHLVLEGALTPYVAPGAGNPPTTLRVVYNWDELLEGMNTWPCAEVYVENWETSSGSETDRYVACEDDTKRLITAVLVRVDVYARHRSQLNEDWRDALSLGNAVETVLEDECGCPLFALTGIKALHWRGERVVFERAQTRYTGFRFDLNMLIY